MSLFKLPLVVDLVDGGHHVDVAAAQVVGAAEHRVAGGDAPLEVELAL